MQRENSSTFPISLETHAHGYAVVAARPARGQQLLPAHRLPVIAKTPILVALGVYMAGGRFGNPAVVMTMLLAGALWAVLYALNEATDLMLEHHLVVSLPMRRILFGLCGLTCVAGLWLSPVVGCLLVAMAAGQIAYCVPPMRLKRHWWAVLLLSGMLNPILRLECGVFWGVHSISPLAYLVFVSLHLGASIRSRALLRERDKKLAYRVAPPRTEWAGIACTAVGLLGAYGLCWQGVLPRIFACFVTVAVVFSVYAWSGKVTSVARLRQGWLWFALLALIAFTQLYLNRAH